jgi:tetratricopeptide (TPR) repeat protein
VEAHFNLGLILARRGRFDEAIPHYQTSLDIYPQFTAAHFNLGVALAGCGRLDEAIAEYRKALEIAPQCDDARVNLEAALRQRDKTPDPRPLHH